jgi:hypothetical protein
MNYKSLAEDLMQLLLYEQSEYRVCYDLTSLGYDYDDLTELGFDSYIIEKASRDEMMNEYEG